jgi:hypothetical protein
MSTFADAHLDKMSIAQMAQYDLFLDENDWDIYYWATQEAEDPGASLEGTASGSQTGSEPETDAWRQGKARSGEWAQTIGTFKPAYRPVPARWKNSEVLAMLRKHVISRSAGGVHNDESEVKTSGGGESLIHFFSPRFSRDRECVSQVSHANAHASQEWHLCQRSGIWTCECSCKVVQSSSIVIFDVYHGTIILVLLFVSSPEWRMRLSTCVNDDSFSDYCTYCLCTLLITIQIPLPRLESSGQGHFGLMLWGIAIDLKEPYPFVCTLF